MAEIDQALVERMVAHFRAVAKKYQHVKDGSGNFNEELREVRAILAELPKPVDPDLVSAREIYARIAEKVHEDRIDAEHARSGVLDDSDAIRAALAAIKRGRELQKQEWERP